MSRSVARHPQADAEVFLRIPPSDTPEEYQEATEDLIQEVVDSLIIEGLDLSEDRSVGSRYSDTEFRVIASHPWWDLIASTYDGIMNVTMILEPEARDHLDEAQARNPYIFGISRKLIEVADTTNLRRIRLGTGSNGETLWKPAPPPTKVHEEDHIL